MVALKSIASQLKDLSRQVLHDSSHVDGGTSSNTFGIVSLAEKTVDTSNGELESSTAGPRLCLSLNLSSFATSRHDDDLLVNCCSKLTEVSATAAIYAHSRLSPGSEPLEDSTGDWPSISDGVTGSSAATLQIGDYPTKLHQSH